MALIPTDAFPLGEFQRALDMMWQGKGVNTQVDQELQHITDQQRSVGFLDLISTSFNLNAGHAPNHSIQRQILKPVEICWPSLALTIARRVHAYVDPGIPSSYLT